MGDDTERARERSGRKAKLRLAQGGRPMVGLIEGTRYNVECVCDSVSVAPEVKKARAGGDEKKFDQ